MEKFKVGDKVRAINNMYGITNVKNNWEGIVIKTEKERFDAKTTKCDYGTISEFYNLAYSCFERIEDVTIVEHLIRGNKTIIKLSNGKVGIAKCSPEDEFDISTGATIAIARAYGKVPEVEQKSSKYREVHREAKPGEYIKLIETTFSFEKVGDILKVSDTQAGVKHTDYPKGRNVRKSICRELWYHSPGKYVVLEGYKSPVKENYKDTKPVFKVGQLVKIKEWEEMKKEYGLDKDGDIKTRICFCNGPMRNLCGAYAEIIALEDYRVFLKFINIEKKYTGFPFSTDMIKPVE